MRGGEEWWVNERREREFRRGADGVRRKRMEGGARTRAAENRLLFTLGKGILLLKLDRKRATFSGAQIWPWIWTGHTKRTMVSVLSFLSFSVNPAIGEEGTERGEGVMRTTTRMKGEVREGAERLSCWAVLVDASLPLFSLFLHSTYCVMIRYRSPLHLSLSSLCFFEQRLTRILSFFLPFLGFVPLYTTQNVHQVEEFGGSVTSE